MKEAGGYSITAGFLSFRRFQKFLADIRARNRNIG